jgi:hypothetical protein
MTLTYQEVMDRYGEGDYFTAWIPQVYITGTYRVHIEFFRRANGIFGDRYINIGSGYSKGSFEITSEFIHKVEFPDPNLIGATFHDRDCRLIATYRKSEDGIVIDLKSNNETLSEMYPDIEVLCLIQRATNFIPEAIKTLNSIK